MQQYPYNAPIIMTDPLFLVMGGQIGNTSVLQRQYAYALAEEQVTEYLSSFLAPTIVTGSYFWKGENPLVLDYGHVLSIKAVYIDSVDSYQGYKTITTSGAYAPRNAEYGYLDVANYIQVSGYNWTYPPAYYTPYAIRVVYESGLSTGTSSQPAILTALTIASQINLNEMDLSLSNEGTADIGIESFSNQRYSEHRAKMSNTIFGNSALATRAARLIKKYRSRPSIVFH
jgi:hypothetical protein